LEFVFLFVLSFNLIRWAFMILFDQGVDFSSYFILFIDKNIFFTIMYGALVVLWLLKPSINRWLFFQKKSDAQRV
jgi:hypothetical protein